MPHALLPRWIPSVRVRPLLFVLLSLPSGLVASQTEAKPAGLQLAASGGVSLARYLDIFSPLQTERATLSPDGRYLAYSYREGSNLSVAVIEIDRPQTALTKVLVGSSQYSTPMQYGMPGEVAAQLLHFSWSSPRRVAIMTNGVAVLGDKFGWMNAYGQLMAFDADGANPRFLAGGRDFAALHGIGIYGRFVPATIRVIGIDREGPGSLLVEVGRRRITVLRPSNPANIPIDWSTVRVATDNGKISSVRDSEAARLRTRLAARNDEIQKLFPAALRELRSAIPSHQIEVCEADDRGNRFLARVQNSVHPGSFHVFDRAARRGWDLIRCAPVLDTGRIAETLPFDFAGADGTRSRGVITLPRQARVKPFPLLVICPSGSNDTDTFHYRPELLAFAEMGMAVLRLDLAATPKSAPDQPEKIDASAAATQVLAAIDAAAARFPVNPKRAALFSTGDTGELAYQLLLAAPERFGAGIAYLPTFPPEWQAPSPPRGVDRSSAPPLQVFTDPGNDRQAPRYRAARSLHGEYQRGGAPAELVILPLAFNAGLPESKAGAFMQMEEFLNVALFNYIVELGPLREADDVPDGRPGVKTNSRE